MAPANVVTAESVTVKYNRQVVLDEITFAIEAEGFTGIIGPNGAGKTTLIRTLLGLVKPSSGKIRIFGHPPGMSHSLIGYVPQVTKIEPNFPVRVKDVVMMGRYGRLGLGRYPGEADRVAVEESLERTGIKNLAQKHFGSLSGGERQKTLIARALCGQPKLLLLDEPTTGVDILAEGSFYEMLHALQKELGMTIILVSHDTGVISNHVSDLLCLNHKIFCHGKPSEVITDEVIGKAYGQESQVVAHAHHSHEPTITLQKKTDDPEEVNNS